MCRAQEKTMKIAENSQAYAATLPSLARARFGSYLILPFHVEESGFRADWADRCLTPRDVNTVDLNEIARSMMSRDGRMSIGSCWLIPRDVLLREMEAPAAGELKLSVETEAGSRPFSLTDSWLYVFHSQVAFLAIGVVFDSIETLADIVNIGGVSSRAAFRWEDGAGSHAFALDAWIETLAAKGGLRPFFSSKSNPFLDVFTDTLAVVPQRFPDLDVMRQAAYNLHLMIPFDNPVTENSEEDLHFIYARIGEISRSYRWACCVTSQTLAYLVADPDLDLDRQMEIRGRAGLPLVMLALYEKYTCLHYTDIIAGTDLRHLERIRELKREMLEFQAYGTLSPANLSRWDNIRQIYSALLEAADIPRAVEDVDHKINILAEHQRELEARRTELLTNLITAFGIVSILASVLTVIQILTGGNTAVWIALVLTVVLILTAFLLALHRRRSGSSNAKSLEKRRWR